MRKLTGKTGASNVFAVILIIIIILLIAGIVWLLFFSNAGGLGANSSENSSNVSSTVEASQTTAADTIASEATTADPESGKSTIQLFNILIKGEEIICNDIVYPDLDMLKSYIEENRSDNSEIIIADEKAIMQTYKSVTDMLDGIGAQYSEKFE